MAVDTRLYDLLGVAPTATAAEIKKAYRKKAVENHPDRGGDTQLMQEINVANEVLSDSEKRQIYDDHGMEGLQQQGGGGGVNAADLFGGLFGSLFSNFGGQGRSASRSRGPRKPQPAVFRLNLTLEDLYTGVTKKMAITRQVPCASCNGSGATEPNAERACIGCNGQGVKIVTHRVGPGMVQRMQTTCEDCGGQGRVIPPELKCKVCSGQKTQSEKKILEVQVPPGAEEEQQFLCPGEGNQNPGAPAGDVVWVLRVARHRQFERRGSNLVSQVRVSLAEALTGCRVKLPHLDGRRLVLRTKPGEVVKPGSFRRVRREGMPVLGNAAARGDLFVRFDVLFPDRLGTEEAEELSQALAASQVAPELAEAHELGDSEVECFLEEVEVEGSEMPYARL